MIRIENLSKTYPLKHGREQRFILNNINLNVAKGEKWGILGRNGAGKSTLVRLISGAEKPNTGKIVREMTVSWPLALGDAFQSSLTGRDNTRLICRAYDVEFEKSIAFIEEFSELGAYMREPVKNYSSGMSARLAFAISMIIEFDCYLIDEVIAVGDYRFVEKCETELFKKRNDRAMIMVSHNADFIKRYCTKIAVLHMTNLHTFDNVDAGLEYYYACQ